MKKIIIYTLFPALAIFLFLPIVSRADIIPIDSHILNQCVKIINLDKFSNIVLIGRYTGPEINGYKTYQIKNKNA